MKIVIMLFLIGILFVAGCVQPSPPEQPPEKPPEQPPKMTCEQYCPTLPHIQCVGKWNISGTYPNCICEFICDVEGLPEKVPAGERLSNEGVSTLAKLFDDQPLAGGQDAPWIMKFVNEKTFLLLQLDKDDVSEATGLRYMGIGVKGVFCAETQPDSSFVHFHKFSAPTYDDGHGGVPGAEGYWLSFVAVDEFDMPYGRVTPGVDYDFFPTPPPECGAELPEADFSPADAGALTKEELDKLVAFFDDNPLTGGQVQPRKAKWVNEDNFIFLQFDNSSNPSAVRYFGLGTRGVFCEEKRPSEDFSHLHTYNAPKYGEGHAKEPADEGYWLLWLSVDEFQLGNRSVGYGVDREFALLVPPKC